MFKNLDKNVIELQIKAYEQDCKDIRLAMEESAIAAQLPDASREVIQDYHHKLTLYSHAEQTLQQMKVEYAKRFPSHKVPPARNNERIHGMSD